MCTLPQRDTKLPDIDQHNGHSHWFGLINQVSYTFAASNRMQPFRQALKPGTPFVWNKEQPHTRQALTTDLYRPPPPS